MDNWTQIKVRCLSSDIDTVASVMSMMDNGLLIEDANEIDQMNSCYGELIDESMKTADRTHGAVSIYIPEDRNPAYNIDFIKNRLNEIGIKYELTLSGIREEDWANSWKKYFKPIKIGKKLVIVPSWEKYEPATCETVIKIDPGMAFGTGTHETTCLCANMIENYVKSGDKVLDVGTGSGILAIAAAKMGACLVNAYDIDPIAVKVAKENCSINNCTNINCEVSDLLDNVKSVDGGYDFVSANIVADIIVRMAPNISKFIKTKGLLAVSGIIDTQSDRVKKSLENYGFQLLELTAQNDWNAMLFIKP